MANLQKLIDLDGLSYFLGQIKAKFVRSVNGIKPDSKGNVNIANMEGATSDAAGKAGLVPIPATGKQDMALCGDATFKVLPIAGGGTGQTTVAGVRNILGLGNTDGALPIANGGTGADNAEAARKNLGITGIATGMIIQFAGNGDIPTGFLLCNGASVGKATYPALFAAIGYNYGGSGDYFNLPNLIDKFIEGSSTAGITKAAGLPNIQGYCGIPSSVSAIGAFAISNNTAVQEDIRTGGNTTHNCLVLNASKSSAIYGNSSTVQPPALTMRYIIKAFAGAADNSTDLAITNVANDLINLATKVKSHVYVMKSYRNGTEWYRVWSDGWVEQGGRAVSSSVRGVSVTLLKPYADRNYTIVGQAVETGSSLRNGSTTDVIAKTATSFVIGIYGGGAENNWYACGQGA